MPSSARQAPDRPTIAVLGTGKMGAPIARNLLAAGFPVTVWNRTESRAAALVQDGATLASSPLVAASDGVVVLTMLADGAATAETMDDDGVLSRLGPDSIWIQMGTVGVDWTERLADLGAENDVAFVDAPVSGSTGPAPEGELVVLASGPENTRWQVQPIFDAIGRHTFWLGRAGNGSRMKVTLNNWLAASTEALAETL